MSEFGKDRNDSRPSRWDELVLTLPVFLGYQLGVVFLGVRNATDMVTSRLLGLVHGDLFEYVGLTGGIGLAAIVLLAIAGRGNALRPGKLVQIAIEGAAYATVMSFVASWVAGRLFAGAPSRLGGGPIAGLVMSLGAGFYEELVFRAILFGLGAKLVVWLFVKRRSQGRAPTALWRQVGWSSTWAVVSAGIFSGAHYLGPMADVLDARSFVVRSVLGLALTAVYSARGFAAAVWTHALYDIWVLVL